MLGEIVDSWIYLTSCFFVGACIGSFLNVVIYRLPRMLEQNWQREAAAIRGEPIPEFPKMNLASPRSNCPKCGHLISALENIPLISYFLLKGRCRQCKTPISLRYPSVELLTATLSALIAYKYGASYFAFAAMFFSWALTALAFIDFDTHLLPDNITLPLLWAGIVFNLFSGTISLDQAVLGAVIGYLLLWSIYWLFKLVTNKEGMGYGDFKLLGAIGAFLGWKILIPVIFISSVAGAIVGIGLIFFKNHRREIPIPFGPFLSIAGILALFTPHFQLI